MSVSRASERGIALAIALFALVVIGALVSGSFFAGRLEQQSGQNLMFAAQALEAAETGLADVLASPVPAAVETLAIGGGALDLGPLNPAAGSTAARQVVRLTGTLFFIRSTGTRRDAAGGSLASRTIGLLVRVAPEKGGVPSRFAPLAERAWVQLS
jgi:Tfp pilus assembly protein PilX